MYQLFCPDCDRDLAPTCMNCPDCDTRAKVEGHADR